ncbi:MAG: hypothetical protein EON48_03930 [Acetobacteraceae bacterium]|nr:MAG: hypothetical protein EON48_03930 [Acetobacteraceae bacterium]
MLLPSRAADLLALGEPEKAATLLATWLNQSGGLGDLPPILFTDDTPAMLGAFALTFRIQNATFAGTRPQDEAARLLALMREDRLAAWVAYVHIQATQPRLFDLVGDPLAGTGLSSAQIEARIEDASALRAVWFGFSVDDIPTPAATAIRAREALQGRAELAPVTRLCQAHCSDSLATCEAAMLAYPGLPQPGVTILQPFASTLDPAEFAASDRGLFTLMAPRRDSAATTDRATAEGLNACYGKLLARRDTLAF